uniref:Putative secreted protein n=1 Tax=Ixodes ricinus TaxID=34613 RepID=A0A6B0U9N7_IXORI
MDGERVLFFMSRSFSFLYFFFLFLCSVVCAVEVAVMRASVCARGSHQLRFNEILLYLASFSIDTRKFQLGLKLLVLIKINRLESFECNISGYSVVALTACF